ncbi:uncharacterized protein LOC123553468 isoform X2 [Mercenaria mercenaria]|uniref:uncharacterized protein LOC123553468 isoform X2 n=1 Tax=Mercenaria mercenaria TaxID=6596 RepID=UPI00234F76CA|nr:uncharacterized protein LOC123553468 isoform X2 [Mercenaria mercenaria]
MLLLLSVLFCMLPGLSGFILDDVSTTKGTTVTKHAQDTCSIDMFKNCLAESASIFNVTENGEITLNREGLMNYLCGSEASETFQCYKDHLDTTCGPGTFAYTVNKTLAGSLPDFYYNKLCRNNTDYYEYLTCQTMIVKVRSYYDCISGIILNKTYDYAEDPCNATNGVSGCMYKYLNIMCPNAIKAYKESINISNNVGTCMVDYENSPEAMSCDGDMEKACSVAYLPPPSNSTAGELTEFICSGRAKGYTTCLTKVQELCRSTSIDVSSVLTYSQFGEHEKEIICADKTSYEALVECMTSNTVSDDYLKCSLTVKSNDTCSNHTCVLNAIHKMCPSSAEFYKRLYNNALQACNDKALTTTPVTVVIPILASSSSNLELSTLALVVLVCNALVQVLFQALQGKISV